MQMCYYSLVCRQNKVIRRVSKRKIWKLPIIFLIVTILMMWPFKIFKSNPWQYFSFNYILAHLFKYIYWLTHIFAPPRNITISCLCMDHMNLNYGIKKLLLAAKNLNRVDDHLISLICNFRYYCCYGSP